MSTYANQSNVHAINANGTLQSGLGLGVAQDTIGSPGLVLMSLHILF